MKTKHTLTAIALATLSLSAHANLAQVGPVNPANGFPFWYQDLSGTALDFCLPDPVDPGALQQTACLLSGIGIDPPYVFPTNYPSEVFYFRAVSTPLTVGTARGILVLALEGAFGTGAPAVGQQMVFTRIRLTTGVPEQGDYTLTHPYGTKFFPDVTSQGANRDIFFTEDVGLAPGNFTDALTSKVGPFLNPVVPDAAGNPTAVVKAPLTINGAQFISDGATPELVTGSPFGTNYFMLCGKRPNGTDIKLGDALANGSGFNAVTGQCARIDTFALTGRLHNNVASPIATPIAIKSATFSRDAASGTHLDAYVTVSKPLPTSPTPVVTIAGLNVPPVKMVGPNALNFYYVQGLTVPSNDKPGQLTAINSADNPPSSVTGNVVDDVIINSANYVSDPTTGVGTLTVVTTSSDKGLGTVAAPAPALVIAGYPTATRTLTGGTTDPALTTLVATLLPTDLPPDTVTVESADGGQEIAQVVKGRDVDYSAAGVPFVQNDTATAIASGVAVTIPATLNDVANAAAPITGINIIAPLPSSGTAVVSGGNIIYTPGAVVTDATHPAPVIRYTANSIAGLSNVGSVSVTVTAPVAGAAPIANADGPINVLAGNAVVIDELANDSGNGSALVPSSVLVTNVTGGTATVNTTTGKVTFTAGTTLSTTSGFNYTVANANGIRSASARVSVPVVTENIAFSRFQCRANAWRITGTSSVIANNTLTFYRTNTVPASPTAAQTIGSIAVDALGAFDFRGTGSCTTTPAANSASLKSTVGSTRTNLTVTN